MAYEIQAIVSTQSVLAVHRTRFASAAIVPLVSGFALIPITGELLHEVGASGESGQFYKFTLPIAGWLRAISASAPAAYIEAEFFGGVGGQSATVWPHGEQLLGPTHNSDAINIALRLIGVQRGTSRDEFEAVGLPRHRHTNGWLADAISNDRDG